jgi:hypothetical protein
MPINSESQARGRILVLTRVYIVVYGVLVLTIVNIVVRGVLYAFSS